MFTSMIFLTDKKGVDDGGSTLMRSYRSVPSSWYLGLLVINFGAAGELVVCIDTELTGVSLPGEDDAAADADMGSVVGHGYCNGMSIGFPVES